MIVVEGIGGMKVGVELSEENKNAMFCPTDVEHCGQQIISKIITPYSLFHVCHVVVFLSLLLHYHLSSYSLVTADRH